MKKTNLPKECDECHDLIICKEAIKYKSIETKQIYYFCSQLCKSHFLAKG